MGSNQDSCLRSAVDEVEGRNNEDRMLSLVYFGICTNRFRFSYKANFLVTQTNFSNLFDSLLADAILANAPLTVVDLERLA